MTLEQQIAEKRRQIETIDFIAARCSTDSQARAYEENRRQRVEELVGLERRLRGEEGGGSEGLPSRKVTLEGGK